VGTGLAAGDRVSAPPLLSDGTRLTRRRPLLIALDLDGTVLDAKQGLHPRTRDAVHAAIDGGTTVLIATGRMYRSALPWARRLRVTAPLICYQGALIRTVPPNGTDTTTTLFEDALSPDVALHALRIARAGGWHVQAYLDDRLLCDQDRPEAHLYARIAQVEITFVDDLEVLVGARGSTKIACVVDDAGGAAACEDAMRRELGDQARVTRSLPPFVEVTSPVASKGRALRRLCEHLGVAMADVAAVGDAPNDSDMLEAAGYAVAVQGAREDVVRHADALCAPPDRAGVADVLVALGLAPGQAEPV
jgi:Cof subfamily protein (haloacid dehalogenase superfamily)